MADRRIVHLIPEVNSATGAAKMAAPAFSGSGFNSRRWSLSTLGLRSGLHPREKAFYKFFTTP